MYHDVSHLLSRLINGPLPLRQVCFASTSGSMPELAYQVDFPRLEIVLEGEFADVSIGNKLTSGDVLYVPAGGWNLPQWHTPVDLSTVTTSVACFVRIQSVLRQSIVGNITAS